MLIIIWSPLLFSELQHFQRNIFKVDGNSAVSYAAHELFPNNSIKLLYFLLVKQIFLKLFIQNLYVNYAKHIHNPTTEFCIALQLLESYQGKGQIQITNKKPNKHK